MNPPAPILDWKNIVNYTFVSEFEILRHAYSRVDLASRPWILPANREIASRYFKVVRAREEIHWLNIELRRLYTALHDEQLYLQKTSESLKYTDSNLAAEILDVYHTRARVNQIHLTRLRAIMQMPGYSGSTERGIRETEVSEEGGPVTVDDALPALDDSLGGIELGAEGDEVQLHRVEDRLNDDAQEELGQMGQFIEDMAATPYDDEDGPRSRYGVPTLMMGSFRI